MKARTNVTAHEIMNVEPGMIYIPPPPEPKRKKPKSVFDLKTKTSRKSKK